MTELVLLALSVVLIALCGIFVAAEFALLAVDRAAAERAAENDERGAGGVLAALRTLSTQLSGVQVMITLTNLAVGFLSEPAIATLLHAPLASIGVGGETGEVVAVAVALVLSTLLTMLFGELVPKNLAIALPLRVARAVQGPVRLFTRVARGPIRALNKLADLVLGVVGVQTHEELASARSPDELVSLVRHSAQEGTLEPRTATLLTRSLGFGERRAGDVLTPRPRMITIGVTGTVADLLELVRDTGRSRLPVTGPGGLDDVVGVAELDQAMGVPVAERGRVAVREVMKPATEVPETLALDDVLRAMRAGRSQLAVVIDEYGGTAGLLTAEDLVEELVGDVDDEHDVPAEHARRVPGGWELSGLLRPDEVRTRTGVAVPVDGPFDTLGGLIMQRLGRIPAAGDRLVLAGGAGRDDVTVTVTRMDGPRVDVVHLAAPGGDDHG